MARRPRIGITMRFDVATGRFYLGRDYSEAIEASGGVPVHLPLIPKRDFISVALDGLDGICLPGSDSDVDPKYFGEEPHPSLGAVVPVKDETDLLVLDEAEKRNLPILAICFGMQSLNVSRGGTLIQDIGAQVPDSIKHQQGRPVERHSHTINIDAESLFRAVPKTEGEHLRVNSHHHQAVKTVGRDLVAIAWAKDGIIEAIQDTRNNQRVLGVQWHPELSWRTDPLSRYIFDWFIESSVALKLSEGRTLTEDISSGISV